MNTHYFTRLDNGAPVRAPNSFRTSRAAAGRPLSVPVGSTAAGREHATAEGERLVLVVLRGRHRFRFEYGPGEERVLVGTLLDLAADPDCPLDWADAALLSYDVIRRAAGA